MNDLPSGSRPSDYSDYSKKICIIGAGSSGITAAKNLKQLGIPYDVIEQEDGIGGNWYYGKPHSSVYRSTHLDSSKTLTQYTDFPMPQAYPDFPNHRQILDYLKSYVQHFDLESDIQFNTSVEQVVPASRATVPAINEMLIGASQVEPDSRVTVRAERYAPTLHETPISASQTVYCTGDPRGRPGQVTDGRPGWDVTINHKSHQETRRYGGVIIANGHNWCPRYPELPGEYSGMKLHSSDYKTPDVLEGKRVLVIGAGNSGTDIVVEAATHAVKTFHSTRRGYYYLPKYFMGRPVDQVNEFMLKLRLPLAMRRLSARVLYGFLVGDLSRYGVPKPDHKLFETHPVVSSHLPYHLGHGDIIAKPDVREYCGDTVTFVDGSSEQIDLIIYATGFQIVFPFIDTALLNWRKGYPGLYLNVFHPTYDNLFIAGLIQPDSGQFGLVDYQCQLIARFLWSQQHHPAAAEHFRALKKRGQEDYGNGVKYKDSPRHYVEVEHSSYKRKLQRLIGEMR